MRLLAALVPFLAGGTLLAQEPSKERVDLSLREWFVQMDGKIRDKGHQGSGTWADVDSDLGIDGISPSAVIEIAVEVPSVGTFTLGYNELHFKGSETLPRDILYDDQGFAAGTASETELWLRIYALDYRYPLVRAACDPGTFELSPFVGARLFSGHVEFRTSAGDTDSQLHRPLLMPGLEAAYDLAPWGRVELTLGGLAYSTSKAAAAYFDTSLEVVARPWRGLYAGFGYRFVKNEIEAKSGSSNHNVDIDLRYSGFYLAVGYSF
jgi:hypothetical protein